MTLKGMQLYLKDNHGASAVEFALLAPVFILLLIGILDIGFFIRDSMQLQNTVHTTAAYAAQFQDDANIQTVAEETFQGDYNDVTLTSEFQCECSDGVVAECPISCDADDYQRRFISVTATATYDTLFPYPGISDSLEMTSDARMRVD